MTETATETSTPKGPASLREALTESFKEHTAEATEDDVTDIIPTDDDGQLDASADDEAATKPSEEQSQGDDEVILAPEHWSAEDQEAFTGLPVEAQKYLLKREKQYEKGIQSKSEELKAIQEAFGQYDEIITLRGIDRPTAIRTWSAAQSMLDADPVGGLRTLIQQYPPDVQEKLISEFGRALPDDDQYADPEVKELRKEINRLRRESQQGATQQQFTQQQDALGQVRAFRDAKDEDGNLLHPHFEKAMGTMRGLIASGVVADLESAYQQAVWTLPEYREQFASKQKEEAERAAAKKREAAAARAKKTAKSVNGKNTVPPPPPKKSTLRDDLADAYQKSLRGEL